MTPMHRIEELCETIRRTAVIPHAVAAADKIEMLCRAHMFDHAAKGFDWPAYGFTRRETTMLQTMESRMGETCSRSHLMDALYGGEPEADEPDDSILNVWVCKIRYKLEKLSLPYEIRNLHGHGYRLCQKPSYIHALASAQDQQHQAA